MEIKGMKEFQKELKNMARAAKELQGDHQVPLHELLTDAFLRKHTSFNSFAEFEQQEIFSKYSSFEEIPDDELNAFVSANTKFSNWTEMLEEAVAEYTFKKLGL
jgi:hypothetical protein